MLDSNQRPSVCKTAALATELIGQVVNAGLSKRVDLNHRPPLYQSGALPRLSYVSRLSSRNTRVRTEDTGVRARHVANYAIFLSARLQGAVRFAHYTSVLAWRLETRSYAACPAAKLGLHGCARFEAAGEKFGFV